MPQLTVIDHPLAAHHLAILRDAASPPPLFRAALERLTYLLVYEATKDLTLKPKPVQTPLAPMQAQTLSQRVGVIPILRAGLGMVDPVLSVLPDAEVWHLGLYRDERTLEPVEYYKKLPRTDPVDVALVLDPMLATGGSSEAAIRIVQEWGVKHVKLLSVIAAPEGVEHLCKSIPEARIYVCAVDSHLDDHGFIVPGLGDAGDRIFNAKAT